MGIITGMRKDKKEKKKDKTYVDGVFHQNSAVAVAVGDIPHNFPAPVDKVMGVTAESGSEASCGHLGDRPALINHKRGLGFVRQRLERERLSGGLREFQMVLISLELLHYPKCPGGGE